MNTRQRKSTPSRCYDEAYFLTACEGYETFEQHTSAVSPRLAADLALLAPRPGERILDVGCGRGEVVLHCVEKGAHVYGLDYSAAALTLVRQRGDAGSIGMRFGRADAKALPFPNRAFDKLMMSDIVEHLHPWELARALHEAWRVLDNDGKLIIHTAPNLWYYRFGYPLYRLFERLRGNCLPSNPRDRFPYHHLHVNEQSLLSLKRSLRQAGFHPRVWLANIQFPLQDEIPPYFRTLLKILLGVWPFRWVFRNDVFAVAHKRG